MTKYRYYHGGGTLTRSLCTLPKGGGAHDRAKYGCSMPVQDRRLPADREPDASGHELARHKLGAAAGPHADGCERYLPRGQRGWRGTAYADDGRDSIPFPRNERLDYWYSRRGEFHWINRKRIPFNLQQLQSDHQDERRRSAPQQPAPVPIGVHLASDSLIPERGCAA